MLQHIRDRIENYNFKRTLANERAFIMHLSTISLSKYDPVPRYCNLLCLNKMCIEKKLEFHIDDDRVNIVKIFDQLYTYPKAPIILWRQSKKFNPNLWHEMGKNLIIPIPPFQNKIIELKSVLTKTNINKCTCERKFTDILKHNNLYTDEIIEGEQEYKSCAELYSKSTKQKVKGMYEITKKILQNKSDLIGNCLAHY